MLEPPLAGSDKLPAFLQVEANKKWEQRRVWRAQQSLDAGENSWRGGWKSPPVKRTAVKLKAVAKSPTCTDDLHIAALQYPV